MIGYFTVITWQTPTGFFTRVTVQQCVDNDGPCLVHSVVTFVNTLTVSKSNGTELELIVWQDGDPVLRHQFSLKADGKSSSGSGKFYTLSIQGRSPYQARL